MKIYDCFTFFNELDLLEIRFEELDGDVDYFVISEGDKTHAGKPKEFIFEKNKERYKKWKEKIIYVKAKMPEFNFFDRLLIRLEKKTQGFITRFIGSNFRMGKWKLENFQREEIIQGLKKAKPEDRIMISDIDEIPRPEKLEIMEKILENYDKVGFEQDLFNHYLNGFVRKGWIGTKAVNFEFLKNKLKSNPQRIRLRKFHHLLEKIGIKEKIVIIPDGGWHFNNVGKKEEILEKLNSKAESDLYKGETKEIRNNFLRRAEFIGYIDEKIKIIPLNKKFPNSILKNKEKYKKFIFGGKN